MFIKNGKLFGLYTPKAVKEIQCKDHDRYSKYLVDTRKEEWKKISSDIEDLQKLIEHRLSNVETNYGSLIYCPLFIKRDSYYQMMLAISSFYEFYGQNKGEIFVFDLKETRIGIMDFEDVGNETIFIYETNVLPRYWNLGIGSAMVKLMEKTVILREYKKALGSLSDVDLRDRKEQVIGFWTKNGYKIKNKSISKLLIK